MKKTFRQAHNEEETSLAYELVDRVYKTGEPVVTKEHHYVVTTDEGRKNEMYINEWFYPFHDLLGNIVGVLSCAQDVTEHVKARREAENANATKSAFLANMSHEIRTPLGAILGFADLMKDPSLSHQDRTQFLETISKNGKALTRIIDDILDLAKVESGKLHIEHVKLSLTMLMDEVIDLFRERAKAKGLYLKVKIAKNFPKVIYSDPTRIRQILINIIGNALKFTNTGGVTVEAKHKCADPDKINVSISVRDTGVGISASQRENLFQPFTQADNTTTRKFGGTGLGLSLSSRLAKALGGDVRIQDCRSNYESGCTFIITFTARSNADPHIEQVLAPQFLPAPPLAARVLEGLRILVADDSKDNQFLVTRLLTKNGARVDTANNGKEALTAALQSNYDLVLMDLQMPEMDGYEATRSLIEAGYKKPIVALTAHAMAEERAKTHLAGFSYHLTKPLEPADLISTIARLHSSRLH